MCCAIGHLFSFFLTIDAVTAGHVARYDLLLGVTRLCLVVKTLKP